MAFVLVLVALLLLLLLLLVVVVVSHLLCYYVYDARQDRREEQQDRRAALSGVIIHYRTVCTLSVTHWRVPTFPLHTRRRCIGVCIEGVHQGMHLGYASGVRIGYA